MRWWRVFMEVSVRRTDGSVSGTAERLHRLPSMEMLRAEWRTCVGSMNFVDAQFSETYLSAFKGLDAARHLYESFGFRLCEEAQGTQWGTSVTEQRFVRRTA